MTRRQPDGFRAPAPGEVIDLVIDNLGVEGQGVGRWRGVAVFVPGALPGEKVRARVTRPGVSRGFIEADLAGVERPSPERVEPACPVARLCGGCQLLALSYPAQLVWKTSVVKEALRRIGGLNEIDVRPCLGAERPLGYRNKAQFPVVSACRPREDRASPDRPGPRRLAAGLYRRRTHDVVPVETCPLQRPVNNRILAAVVRLASEYGVSAYDEDTGRGLLRHILARVSRDGRQAMAVLVTAEPRFPDGRRLAEALRRVVPEVTTVVQNINTRRTNVILGPRNVVLSGPGYITDRLGDLEFRVSATSFFQVNPEQAEVLYGVVAGMAEGARRAADVYCGVGTIALYLASRLGSLKEIVGIEANPAAVRDAAANARANGVDKASFVCGDAAAVLRDMAAARLPLDTVVLDPPRKGCEPEVLAALADLACRRIVYVSCNPATLARDLSVLHDAGYRVAEVQPVDMFPQTTHVECCALLVGQGGSGGRGSGRSGRSGYGGGAGHRIPTGRGRPGPGHGRGSDG
jgi:23S rRNA (uracil1939-C5)-methyltransferase